MRRGWSSEESGSGEGEKIRVGFKSQDGQSDYYRVQDGTKIQELVQAFCTKRKIEYKYTRFIHNGKKLPYRGTVGEVGLTDQDEILVMTDHHLSG